MDGGDDSARDFSLSGLCACEGRAVCGTSFIGLSIKARNAWNITLTCFSFHSDVLGTGAPLPYSTVYYTTLGMGNG